MKKNALTSAVMITLLAALACASPLAVGGPTPEYEPIPVSTESAGALLNKFSALSAASGEVTVSITESELTSYLAEQLAAQPDAKFTNPQIYLRDGEMKLYSTVIADNFTANALVVMKAAVENGQMTIGLEKADFGPVPMPQGMLSSLTSSINDKLLSLIAKLPAGVAIKAITIAEGNLTLTAVIKP